MKTLIIEMTRTIQERPMWVFVDTNTQEVRYGRTCQCHRGCDNTDNLFDIEADHVAEFHEDDFYDLMKDIDYLVALNEVSR